MRLGEERGGVQGDHAFSVRDGRRPGGDDSWLRHARFLRRDALHPHPDELFQLAFVANREGEAAGDLFRRRQRQRNATDVCLGCHLGARASYHFSVTILVRSHRRNDDRDELRARVAELEAVLGDRRVEAARVKSELDAFGIGYRKRVGLLHERLDKLELEIAEVELGELSKRVADGSGGAWAPSATPRPEPPARFTSDAARKLFRDVAKAIHPDLARDDLTRDRRHALMIEANRAYALGDEEQLRSILDAWERSPEAVQGSDPEAMRSRLVRRIAQIEEELELLEGDLATLKESPLGKLKAMVDEAAAQGKNLVRDMVGRLKRDILVATNRLDAIRPPEP